MKANQDKVEGRFDKVLSFYWDGIPIPLLSDTKDWRTRTFYCRQLAYTPDYHGATVSLPLDEAAHTHLFSSLSRRCVGPQPASCRIGSHYSQYVGLFRFTEGAGLKPRNAVDEKKAVRVPVECCEIVEDCDSATYAAHCRVRTGRIVQLYKPLIKEHSPLDRHSLRRILVLSSRGCTSVSREAIAREISEVNAEFAHAQAEAIFYYMCRNTLYQQILAPLQLATSPLPPVLSAQLLGASEKLTLRQHFNSSRQQLQKQLFWNPKSRGYFDALDQLWRTKFSRIAVLSPDLFTGVVETASFLSQISASVNALVARVRIEFYANVEEYFFAHIPNASEALLISENDFHESAFERVFIATEVFLTNKLREAFFDGLDRLVAYFDCTSSKTVAKLSKPVDLQSFLRIDVIVSGLFQPQAPALGQLIFGVSEFFVEAERCMNSLPGVAFAVLRTLKLEERSVQIVSHVEVASYRAALAHAFNSAALVVDKILLSYRLLCTIPVQNVSAIKKSTEVEVAEQIRFARQQINNIFWASSRLMYCGRFEIHCATLQETLSSQWKDYLTTLAETFQKTIVSIIDEAKMKGTFFLDALDTTPSTVEELEVYLRNTEAARAYVQELRVFHCRNIQTKVACMEQLFIPVEHDICDAIFDFMKLPEKLVVAAEKAGDMRTKCAPLLRRKLAQLRASTQEYIHTLSTGVTELYNLFNLETCDIAAQTCAELRELVDRIEESLKSVSHEEEVLGLPAEDTFDSFPSLLHYFEVIEQFWTAIFDATKLKDMYNCPISSVNATASVERVRGWRRLIHSSARNLRGYPQLLQLGREQEVALSKYEELGLFLEVISSPNLRKNHWKDIAKLIAPQLRVEISTVMDQSITVRRLLDAGILGHMAALGQIANQAHGDYEVEAGLEGMKSYGKRTHFVLEDSECNGVARTVVSQQFIHDAAEHVEGFLIRCRAMRRYPNVGLFVQKPLVEWELSCEKSCEMLAAFPSMQERCTWMENCLRALQLAAPARAGREAEQSALLQHYNTCIEATKRLHATLRKPQFSLYTAMVQDTVQDVFLLVKATVEEVMVLLSKPLEQRRSVFPRYHFVSDAQLMEVQFVQPPDTLVGLFPWLFPSVANVEVVDGGVTGVVATDGATLPLVSPVSLAASSPDVWVAQLDRAMRFSILTSVKGAVSAYYRCDLESWLLALPGQVAVLALRILHTDAIRHAAQIGGAAALEAYACRLSDECRTLSQLTRELFQKRVSGSSGITAAEATTRAAFAYARFALRELRSAVAAGVRDVAGLDYSRMLQTSLSPSGDSIRVSCLGAVAEYGLEFVGHDRGDYTNEARWQQSATLVANIELCRTVPLVCDDGTGATSDDVLRAVAQALGRFFFRVEVGPQMTAETLIPALCGCIETGAILCLAHCEELREPLLTALILPLVGAYQAMPSPGKWELPYGANGAPVSLSPHPLFRLTFSSSCPAEVPRCLYKLCEAVHPGPLDIAEFMHDWLVGRGVLSLAPLCLEEIELGELYRQLMEQLPALFTVAHLCVVLRDLASSSGSEESCGDQGAQRSSENSLSPSVDLIQRFVASLTRTSAAVLATGEGAALYDSVSAQIAGKLLLPSCGGAAPRAWAELRPQRVQAAPGDDALKRFSTLMELHRRVLVVGPRFSGKSLLWKGWLRGQRPLVLSPGLISVADFYGSASQRGYLSHLAPQASDSTAPPTHTVLVLEGVDAPSSFQLFAGSWYDGTRLPEGTAKGQCVVPSPWLRIIGTAERVASISPGVLDGFAMMALDGPTSWQQAIRGGLSAIPERKAAEIVLVALLPPLVERAAKLAPAIVGSAHELTNMCALAQRVAALCSRWYTYALTVRTHTDVLAPQDDGNDVDLQLFAARCAVMAASWSVGLSLLPDDRDAMKLTMLSVEADVRRALASCDLSGEVFPELTHKGRSPLEQVALPQGWVTFDDAARRTDLPLSWANYRLVNPQLQSSLQVLAMPSRVSTLRSMECLINCGQHVLLHAAAESGKTTLLQTVHTCGDWVAQVFQMNASFHATEMQQRMASALSKRSDGRYGPPQGRRLVVCIDDLHLSLPASSDNPVPRAGSLVHYCEQFRAISTPALGTVPTADVVFCAAALHGALAHKQYCTGALSGCVDVQLPPLDGKEVASGLFQLCDLASSRKRAKGFPQECASFLDLVHGAYCELKKRSEAFTFLDSQAPYVSAQSPEVTWVAERRLPRMGGGGDGRRAAPGSADGAAASFCTEHFRDLLEAVEVVRLHLLSTVSDIQVSGRVFIGLTTFYDDLLTGSLAAARQGGGNDSAATSTGDEEDEEQQQRQRVSGEFRDAVVQAAEGTLRNSIRGNVEFGDLAQELSEALSRGDESEVNEGRVAQCIMSFESALKEEEETDLGALDALRPRAAQKKASRSGATVRAETRCVSVVFSYPDSLRIAAVRPDGLNRDVYVRRSSSVAMSSARTSRSSSVGSAVSGGPASLGMSLSPMQAATPTYQTTWLTTRFVQLDDALSVPGSHLLLVGEKEFGMRRLFRLWCASTHTPFTWFRVDPTDNSAEMCSRYFAEMRTLITYACRNSVHAVAYVPPALLRTTEVLRILDALVRSGDVSSLFDDEERHALLHGCPPARSRSLRPFVFVNDSELRSRVRGSLNFVFHVESAATAAELAAGYPFLSPPITTMVPLYTAKLERLMMEELALGVLHGGQSDTVGIRRLADEEKSSETDSRDSSQQEQQQTVARSTEFGGPLSMQAACVALCSVFRHVATVHPTTTDQFIEFVRLYKELDKSARARVVESARTGSIIAGRADAAEAAIDATVQRSRGCAEEQDALHIKMALLTEKLAGEEAQQAARTVEASQLREQLKTQKETLQRRRKSLGVRSEEAREAVAKALTQVRKAKPGAVRALGASRLPDKGLLLLHALYAVLGEEAPLSDDDAAELWALSMKRMCTKEFAAELATLLPESHLDRLSVVLPFREEVDTVRYGPTLPYAQVLADFVVAWVDCVHFLAETHPTKLAEIADAQTELEDGETALVRKQEEISAAAKSIAQTRKELDVLGSSVAALQKKRDTLAENEGRLRRYTGLVDRFARFLAGPGSVTERARRARCAVGDTLLVAAFSSLLGSHDFADSLYTTLQQVIRDSLGDASVSFSPFKEFFGQLLYQTHAPRTETLTAIDCEAPWTYKALLMCLHQRRASRWTLVGGAGPVLMHELLKFLSFSCSGAVAVSACDPHVSTHLAAAMKAGQGVLLCDVDSAAAVDLARSLNPVYERLKAHYTATHHGRAAPDMSSPSLGFSKSLLLTDSQHSDSTRPVMAVWFDGQEVRVHPQFFLICTCFPALSNLALNAQESLHVVNFHTPLDLDAREDWLLGSVVRKSWVSTKIASMQEEVVVRQQAYVVALRAFMRAHDAAAALLAEDLTDIGESSRGDVLLAETEQMLAQVDMYEGQMAQTTSYVQSIQKMVRDGWDAVLPAIKAVAHLAEQIEVTRLQRPWRASGLDSCIGDIAYLSPVLAKRIAPLSFGELPIAQKCYYALVHYVRRVVDLLSPGWPTPLKGIFSLSILSCAMSVSPATFAAETHAPMFSREQSRVLSMLTYDRLVAGSGVAGGEARGTPSAAPAGAAAATVASDEQRKGVIRQLFASSDDPLLRRLARATTDIPIEDDHGDSDAGGETSFYIAQFFAALLELDVVEANTHATSLFQAFMTSVTGPQPGTPQQPGRSAARDKAGANTPSHDPSTESAAASAARSGHDAGAGDKEDGSSDKVRAVTMEEHMQRAVSAHLPLCLVSHDPLDEALLWFEGEVGETRWAFEWREVMVPPPLPPSLSAGHEEAASEFGDASESALWRATLSRAMESAKHRLVTLARAPLGEGRCGVCLALLIDLPPAFLPSAGDGVYASVTAEEDMAFLREKWQQLLAFYASSSCLRGGDFPASSSTTTTTAATALCLTLICSAAAHSHLWSNLPAVTPAPTASLDELNSIRRRRSSQAVPCCYIDLSTHTPQQELLGLLRRTRRGDSRSGVVQFCDAALQQIQTELIARSARDAVADKRTTRVRGPALAKLNAAHDGAAHAYPLPPLPSDLSTTALTSLQTAMTELRACATLLVYEVAVAYVASMTRLHILDTSRDAVQTTGGSPHLEDRTRRSLLRRRLRSPAPLQRLHRFLAAWVQQRYEAVIAQLSMLVGSPAAQAGMDASEVGEGTSKANTTAAQLRAPSSLPVPIHVGSHHDSTEESAAFGYGMQAYYYLRRNQPAWGLLLDKAERRLRAAADGNACPKSDLLNPALCSVMRGGDLRPPSGGVAAGANHHRLRLRKQQCQIVDEAGAAWRAGLFALARKSALHFFCVASHSSRTISPALPSMELQAQWGMLCALIGAAGDADEVSCLWGPLRRDWRTAARRWHQLSLPAHSPEAFDAEVASAASDLMELCGEESAALRFREMHHDDLALQCFPRAPPPRHAEENALNSQPVVDGASEKAIALQDEAARALTEIQSLQEGSGLALGIAVTPVEAMLSWESSSLDMCFSHQTGLCESFVRMVTSLAAGVAPKRVHSGTLPTPVQVWLPALQHPLYDLHYLTSARLLNKASILVDSGVLRAPRLESSRQSRSNPFADLVCGGGSGGSEFLRARWLGDVGSALLLVATQTRFLSASDVVLCGAALSPSLRERVLSVGQWADSGAVSEGEPFVLVVRSALLRRSRGSEVTQPRARRPSGAAIDAPEGSELAARGGAVEVGMRAHKPADAAFDDVTWCSAVCPPPSAGEMAWESRATCRTGFSNASSPSHSAATSTTSSGNMQGSTGDFFVTAVDSEASPSPGAGAAALAGAEPVCVRTWSFGDAPVPVQWRSVVEDSEAVQQAELYLCVEYEKGCQGDDGGAASVPAYSGDRSGAARGRVSVSGEVFSITAVLDSRVWIL